MESARRRLKTIIQCFEEVEEIENNEKINKQQTLRFANV